MKLFYKRKYDYTTEYGIFGIRIKFTNKKKKNALSMYRHIPIPCPPTNYIFMNTNKFGDKEKKWFLAKLFYERLGYYPNFSNPRTFNEKIHWMDLNYFNPVEQICNDKIEFKEYIKEKLGDGYTAKLLKIYETVDDINLEELPKSFVLKNTLTGDDYGVRIVKDKSKINIDYLKYDANNLLQDWASGYYACLNRNTKNRPMRLFAEEYLGPLDDNLNDYKFMCFHGKFKLGYVDVRIPNQKGKIFYFDENWNLLPIKHIEHTADKSFFPPKPKNFTKMVELAEQLAADFPFVRIDFYDVEDKVYLGEFTFNPDGGFGKFEPEEWDLKLGEMLDLTNIDKKYLINQKAKIHMVVRERERERERVILLPAKKVLKVA